MNIWAVQPTNPQDLKHYVNRMTRSQSATVSVDNLSADQRSVKYAIRSPAASTRTHIQTGRPIQFLSSLKHSGTSGQTARRCYALSATRPIGLHVIYIQTASLHPAATRHAQLTSASATDAISSILHLQRAATI